MKKRIGLLLMLCCFLLVGCGTTNAGAEEATDDSEGSYPPGRVTKSAYLEEVYEEINTGYTIVAPNWGGIDEYNGEYYHTTDKGREHIHVTQYSGDFGYNWAEGVVDISQHKDSTDILDVLFKQFSREANGRLSLSTTTWFTNVDYEIISTETINGVEMTKFEGTFQWAHRFFKDEEGMVYSFVAYGIDASQVPVLVIGYDTHDKIEKYGETLIPELSEILDKMVQTFTDCTKTYEKVEAEPSDIYERNKGTGSFELGSGYMVYSPEEMSAIIQNLEMSYLSCKKNEDGAVTDTYIAIKNNSPYPITSDMTIYLDFNIIVGDKKYSGVDTKWVDEKNFNIVALEEKIGDIKSFEDVTVEISLDDSYNARATYTDSAAAYTLKGESDIVLNSTTQVEGGYILHDDGHISVVESSVEK